MKRILFVDDEQQILDGLKDLLRKQRKQWDMVFALGGEAALAELDRGPFDVVVSDMRMPGIDGAALLQKIKEQYPTTARIILSDHIVEKELLGVTHAEVGAYLLGLWGLPLTIVEAVAYHHQLELVAPTDIVVAVHVANALSHLSVDAPPDPSVGGRLNVAFVESSVFGSELSRWRTLAEEELRAASRES